MPAELPLPPPSPRPHTSHRTAPAQGHPRRADDRGPDTDGSFAEHIRRAAPPETGSETRPVPRRTRSASPDSPPATEAGAPNGTAQETGPIPANAMKACLSCQPSGPPAEAADGTPGQGTDQPGLSRVFDDSQPEPASVASAPAPVVAMAAAQAAEQDPVPAEARAVRAASVAGTATGPEPAVEPSPMVTQAGPTAPSAAPGDAVPPPEATPGDALSGKDPSPRIVAQPTEPSRAGDPAAPDAAPAPSPPAVSAVTARSAEPMLALPDAKPISAPPAVVVSDLPVAIATLARQGERTFEIRLDPAELGKIDVSLTIDRDGAIRTHIVVERPETVQLLRNDTQRLEQALGESGLRTDPGGIGISLRNGSGQNQQQGQNSGDTRQPGAWPGQPQQEPSMQPLPYRRALGMTQRLDLVL